MTLNTIIADLKKSGCNSKLTVIKKLEKPTPYDYLKKEESKPSPFENVSNHNGIIDDDLPF